MSDAVVADFVTDIIPDTSSYDEPVRGRVLMNRQQVVLVTPEGRTSFPIDQVFDVAYGSAPRELREFFEDTVTVAYRAMGGRHVALIEGADETVSRFTTLLFKGVLNGTEVGVKHPARVGGRVTDQPFRTATLAVAPRRVRFQADSPLTVDVSTVSHFERVEREVDGQSRSVLSVRHADGHDVVTTEVAIHPERKMNVLGRFLRIEYSQLREELADVSLSDQEIEVLVGIYSGATEGSLAGMLGVDASRVSSMLSTLVQKGLLAETAGGWELTATGTLAVGKHLEDVNL
ncbi:MAG: CheF family chemotaxis protein [Halanaeroarchaeum sp.]